MIRTPLPALCSFRAATKPSPPLLPLPQITPMRSAEGYCEITNSATAVPAFSMSVSEGTPKRSLVTRSISRISAAVTIFMLDQPFQMDAWRPRPAGPFDSAQGRLATGPSSFHSATIKQNGPPRISWRAANLDQQISICHRVLGLLQRLHFTVLAPVAEINRQPDDQPHDQPDLGRRGQKNDECTGEKD